MAFVTVSLIWPSFELPLYTEKQCKPQLYALPIDIQYTDEGMWFTAGCEAVVDPTHYPEEELRV